jgi:hypothetical protein
MRLVVPIGGPEMRMSPSTVLSALALFFALGGSALAVSEAVKPQARCQPGAVRGYVVVIGDPSKGIVNLGDKFTSTKKVIGPRFNCAGPAPQVRRVNTGIYEVRFPGNTAQVATASSAAAATTVGYIGGRVFRIDLWAPGRQDAIDTSFTVVVV